MKTKFISLSIALLMGVSAWAQVPTVSIYEDCSKNGKVEDIRPTTEPENVQAVDLGLPSGIKWASCNIGAEKPEDSGNYYAWGEVLPKDYYSWATYKYANGNGNKFTKYCNNASYGDNGFTDNKTTLAPEDDAAQVSWGGSWRMPTDAEWAELIANCTWTWTTQNGINGYQVTGKTNSNSIFLPAAGCRDVTDLRSVGNYGDYWSSSLNEGNPDYAWGLYFDSDYVGRSYYGRFIRSIRPPCLPVAVEPSHTGKDTQHTQNNKNTHVNNFYNENKTVSQCDCIINSWLLLCCHLLYAHPLCRRLQECKRIHV